MYYPPNAKLATVTGPAVEPITLAEARHFLRIEDDDTGTADDALISALIVAARLECEQRNDRTFITTQRRLTLDYLPYSVSGGIVGAAVFGLGSLSFDADDGSILLPQPPAISLDSITYTDTAGLVQSVDVAPSAGSVVASLGTPGRIAPGYGRFFPFARPTIAAASITYTAGYGPNPADVPETVRLAIRLLVAHYYAHRTTNAEVPAAVTNLLNATRWGGYG